MVGEAEILFICCNRRQSAIPQTAALLVALFPIARSASFVVFLFTSGSHHVTHHEILAVI